MLDFHEKKHILVVEDDPNVANLIRVVLSKKEMQVSIASNGLEALSFLKSQYSDIIISDIMMPKMDGYALREALLKEEDLRTIPFIFLSAKDQTKDIVKGMEYDVETYIPKPFDPEILVAKVSAILRKYDRINKLLLYDTLTNVFNRRTLEFRLSNELKRVSRYHQSLSIIMADLDHFKKINDKYGHDFGDVVLKSVASLFKEELRDTDFVGRVGGEEFVLVLPNTDKEAGLFVANRMRSRVEAYTFKYIQVTFSGGVATAPEDGVEMKTLLKKADQAMYRAKENGRNQIVSF